VKITVLWGGWFSSKFGALRLQCRRFESHSSRHVGALDKSFTRNCLDNVIWRGFLVVKLDSCNNLLSSIHTLLVNILRFVGLYVKRKHYYYYYVANNKIFV